MIDRQSIMIEIEGELDQMLANAPGRKSDAFRKEVREEFVAYSQRVLDALSSEELQSTSAYERFIETTLAQARMRLHGVTR
jgi:hypothetical protein